MLLILFALFLPLLLLLEALLKHCAPLNAWAERWMTRITK